MIKCHKKCYIVSYAHDPEARLFVYVPPQTKSAIPGTLMLDQMKCARIQLEPPNTDGGVTPNRSIHSLSLTRN